MVINFTHTTVIDWMLPAVSPTGKKVEAAFAVMGRRQRRMCIRDSIYWDQASVLVQLGLLDPSGLPICGAESARKILDPSCLAELLSE